SSAAGVGARWVCRRLSSTLRTKHSAPGWHRPVDGTQMTLHIPPYTPRRRVTAVSEPSQWPIVWLEQEPTAATQHLGKLRQNRAACELIPPIAYRVETHRFQGGVLAEGVELGRNRQDLPLGRRL